MVRVKTAKSANVKSGTRRRTAGNVEEYAEHIPEGARRHFDQLRAAVRSAVPAEATEIISYGIPAFTHDGVIVWFAAFSDHCSLFPKASVIDAFRDELQGFSTSKGTIHFPLDKRLPVALIKRIVKARVKEKENGGK